MDFLLAANDCSWFMVSKEFGCGMSFVHTVLMHTCVKHYKKTSPFGVGNKEKLPGK